MEKTKECKYCKGTKWLDQKGIMAVYLLPCWYAAGMIISGIIMGVFLSQSWFLLAGAGLILPLVNADLRLIFYPVVAIAAVFGKRPNCPKC